MIDRRAFLRRLGFGTVSAAAAVVAFDVEKLLWVPKPIVTVPAMPLRYTARLGGFWTDDCLRQLVRYSQQIADDTYAQAVERYRLLNGR